MKCYTATISAFVKQAEVELKTKPHIAVCRNGRLKLGQHALSLKPVQLAVSNQLCGPEVDDGQEGRPDETVLLTETAVQLDRRGTVELIAPQNTLARTLHPLLVPRLVLLEVFGSSSSWWHIRCPAECLLSGGIESANGQRKEYSLLLLNGHRIVQIEGNHFMSPFPTWELCLGFRFLDLNEEPEFGNFGNDSYNWSVPDSWTIN